MAYVVRTLRAGSASIPAGNLFAHVAYCAALGFMAALVVGLVG